jgi:hypothetical protein
MKAYQLMMFMLFFSLAISVVNVLHIYNMENQYRPEELDSDYNVANYSASSGGEAVEYRFFGYLISSIILGIVAATIMSYFTKVPADSAFAYSLFAGSFWGIAFNALDTIWRIDENNAGVMVIVFVFAIALGAVFVVGILQLIRGGWESFQ